MVGLPPAEACLKAGAACRQSAEASGVHARTAQAISSLASLTACTAGRTDQARGCTGGWRGAGATSTQHRVSAGLPDAPAPVCALPVSRAGRCRGRDLWDAGRGVREPSLLSGQVRGRPPVPHPEASGDHQQVLPADRDGGPGLLPALEAAEPVSPGGRATAPFRGGRGRSVQIPYLNLSPPPALNRRRRKSSKPTIPWTPKSPRQR